MVNFGWKGERAGPLGPSSKSATVRNMYTFMFCDNLKGYALFLLVLGTYIFWWYVHQTILVPTSSSFLFSQIYCLFYVLLMLAETQIDKTYLSFQMKEKSEHEMVIRLIHTNRFPLSPCWDVHRLYTSGVWLLSDFLKVNLFCYTCIIKFTNLTCVHCMWFAIFQTGDVRSQGTSVMTSRK
jgi:hypothetical protein